MLKKLLTTHNTATENKEEIGVNSSELKYRHLILYTKNKDDSNDIAHMFDTIERWKKRYNWDESMSRFNSVVFDDLSQPKVVVYYSDLDKALLLSETLNKDNRITKKTIIEAMNNGMEWNFKNQWRYITEPSMIDYIDNVCSELEDKNLLFMCSRLGTVISIMKGLLDQGHEKEAYRILCDSDRSLILDYTDTYLQSPALAMIDEAINSYTQKNKGKRKQ